MTRQQDLLQQDLEEDVEEDSGEAVIPGIFATHAMDPLFNPIDGEMGKTDGNDALHLEHAHHLREQGHLHVIAEMIEHSQSQLTPIERDWNPEMDLPLRDQTFRTPLEILVLHTGEEVLLEDEAILTVDTRQMTGTLSGPEAAQGIELLLESATVQ